MTTLLKLTKTHRGIGEGLVFPQSTKATRSGSAQDLVDKKEGRQPTAHGTPAEALVSGAILGCAFKELAHRVMCFKRKY